MSGDVRKVLKGKGFAPGQPRGEEAYPGAVMERIRQAGPKVTEIDLLRKDMRDASAEEKMAGAEYSVLAGRAERLGFTEMAKKLREIASNEMEHHKVLNEILSRWPFTPL